MRRSFELWGRLRLWTQSVMCSKHRRRPIVTHRRRPDVERLEPMVLLSAGLTGRFSGGYQGTMVGAVSSSAGMTGEAFSRYMALGVQGQKIVVVAPYQGAGAGNRSGIHGEIGGGITFTGQFHVAPAGISASGTWSGVVDTLGDRGSGTWSVSRVAGLTIAYTKPSGKQSRGLDGGYEGSYSGTVTTSPPPGITGIPGSNAGTVGGYMAFGVQGSKIVVVAPYQGSGEASATGISGEIGGNITFTGQFHRSSNGAVMASGTWSSSGEVPNSGGATYTASGQWSVVRVPGLSIVYKTPRAVRASVRPLQAATSSEVKKLEIVAVEFQGGFTRSPDGVVTARGNWTTQGMIPLPPGLKASGDYEGSGTWTATLVGPPGSAPRFPGPVPRPARAPRPTILTSQALLVTRAS
jgi:hypothetical protein